MTHFLSQNMFSLGIIKLARSVAELVISELDQESTSAIPGIAFVDSMYSSELIIRASLLKIELENNSENLGEDVVSEVRKIELINGSARLSFLKLPEELERISGKSIHNAQVYYEMNRLRQILLSEQIDTKQLVEPALRFCFECIEPLIIEIWQDIILMHLPELGDGIDEQLEALMERYNINTGDYSFFENEEDNP